MFMPWIRPCDGRIYNQQNMRPPYLRCLNWGEMFPFPKASEQVPYHVTENITTVVIFCVCRIPNDKKEYVWCFQCNGWWYIQPVWAFLTGWSTETGDGSVTPAGGRRVKDIVCISQLQYISAFNSKTKSCYLTTTLNPPPQNSLWPVKYNSIL